MATALFSFRCSWLLRRLRLSGDGSRLSYYLDQVVQRRCGEGRGAQLGRYLLCHLAYLFNLVSSDVDIDAEFGDTHAEQRLHEDDGEPAW